MCLGPLARRTHYFGTGSRLLDAPSTVKVSTCQVNVHGYENPGSNSTGRVYDPSATVWFSTRLSVKLASRQIRVDVAFER